jgi:hypothetical protein
MRAGNGLQRDHAALAPTAEKNNSQHGATSQPSQKKLGIFPVFIGPVNRACLAPLGPFGWRPIGGNASATTAVAFRGAPLLPVRLQCQSRNSGGNPKSNEFRSKSDASPFARLCDAAEAWQGNIHIPSSNPTKSPETGLA